jgi:Kef-type K+ transport system membrane component KefB
MESTDLGHQAESEMQRAERKLPKLSDCKVSEVTNDRPTHLKPRTKRRTIHYLLFTTIITVCLWTLWSSLDYHKCGNEAFGTLFVLSVFTLGAIVLLPGLLAARIVSQKTTVTVGQLTMITFAVIVITAAVVIIERVGYPVATDPRACYMYW